MPFHPVCGTNIPNQGTTDDREKVNCPTCRKMIDDPLSALIETIEAAGLVAYLHDRDCAMWQKKPCDKKCGERAYAKAGKP